MTFSQYPQSIPSNATASPDGESTVEDLVTASRSRLRLAVCQLRAMRDTASEDTDRSSLESLLAQLPAADSHLREAMQRFATRDLWRPFARLRPDMSKQERRLYKQACRRLADSSNRPELCSLTGTDIRAYDQAFSVRARTHGEHEAELGRIGEMLTSAVVLSSDAAGRHRLGRAMLAVTVAGWAASLRRSGCTPQLQERMQNLFAEDWVLEATA